MKIADIENLIDKKYSEVRYEGMQPIQERPDFLQHIDETISNAEMAA